MKFRVALALHKTVRDIEQMEYAEFLGWVHYLGERKK